jgi:hypothetical protein
MTSAHIAGVRAMQRQKASLLPRMFCRTCRRRRSVCFGALSRVIAAKRINP